MSHSWVDAYLTRIGAERPVRPDLDALRELHLRHLRAVPFENLSIHLGEDIVLEREALVAKIVDRRRGGFCYELNGAFGALLSALGYEVTYLAARVYGGGEGPGLLFDHLALKVGPWLADVGYGSHSSYPLLIDERGDQEDPNGVFRIAETPEGDLDVYQDGRREYRLETRPRTLADFRSGCWWQRTSPFSHFTRSLVCSMSTETGRVTLSGRTLKHTADGESTERELGDDAEVLTAYRTWFGIELDAVPEVRNVAPPLVPSAR
jgi:N-hydroxyarylamine O-acetyltransferase